MCVCVCVCVCLYVYTSRICVRAYTYYLIVLECTS